MLKLQKKSILAVILFMAVLLTSIQLQFVEAKEVKKIGVTSAEEFWNTIQKLEINRVTEARIIVKGKDGAKIKKDVDYPLSEIILKRVKSPDNLLSYYNVGYDLSYSYSTFPDLEEFHLKAGYGYTSEEMKKLAKTIKKVKKIVKSWDLKNMTDYQRVAKINDYICDHVTYDYDVYYNRIINPDAYTAYGALFKGKAVCEGYRELADMFLKEIGYECVKEESHNHGWNDVKIGGKYYMLDTTWNDASNNRTTYLLLGKKELNSHPSATTGMKNRAESRLSSTSKSKMKI